MGIMTKMMEITPPQGYQQYGTNRLVSMQEGYCEIVDENKYVEKIKEFVREQSISRSFPSQVQIG
ncbi:unnamed protein product [Heterobilharzia americana]|nr:unnamed protein product [Heterobilharzia americana]